MKLTSVLKDIDYTLIKGSLDIDIQDIKYDSRKIEPNDIYVAIKGYNLNGHDFIPEAIEKKARVIIIEELVNIYGDATIIMVKSTKEALAKLSQNYFGHPDKELFLIGVTGTTGKTTTTHIIKDLISLKYSCGLIGSNGIKYLDQVILTDNTTPDSYTIYKYLREMLNNHITHVVIEASSQSFKLARLLGITFDIGVLTNLTSDHISPKEHANQAEYLACKKELFKNSKQIVINNDSLYLDIILKDIDKPLITYGLKNEADLHLKSYELINNEEFIGSKFSTEGLINAEFNLAMPGLFNIYNALCALCVLALLDIDILKIKEKLLTIKVRGRMNCVVNNPDYKVIIDYAHAQDSLEKLVATMQDYHPNRLISIFGGGGNRDKQRRYALGSIIGASSDLCILTMDNPRFEELNKINADIKEGLNQVNAKYIEIMDRKEAIYYALDNHQKGDIILLIGKGHEEYQDIKGSKYYFSEEAVLKEYFANN